MASLLKTAAFESIASLQCYALGTNKWMRQDTSWAIVSISSAYCGSSRLDIRKAKDQMVMHV